MAVCKAARFSWDRIDSSGGPNACWPWRSGLNRWGYGSCQHNGKQVNASRAAFIDVNGEPAAGLVVCHRCDNPACCNPDHLFAATQAENLADCRAKGRARGGFQAADAHPRATAKLTTAQVQDVRRRHDAGESQSAIARDIGMDSTSISKIVRRLSYGNVP